MQSAEIPQTIAEVSIAFAGLASVVAVLGRAQQGTGRRSTTSACRRCFRAVFIQPLLPAILVAVAAIVACLLLNVTGIFFQREPNPYLLGLYWLLAFSAFQFTRLLLVIRSIGSSGSGDA